MKFIIKMKIKDGVLIPFEHPISIENFVQAFPDVDINNLPNTFAWFERVPRPKIGPYQKVSDQSDYVFDGTTVRDDWRITEMTQEERLLKQQMTKEYWNNNGGLPSWIFDEEKCNFVPPISYPDDGKRYRWNESIIGWEEFQSGE